MTPELTPEQEKEIAELVAQGWDQTAAVVLITESVDDVLDVDDAPTQNSKP